MLTCDCFCAEGGGGDDACTAAAAGRCTATTDGAAVGSRTFDCLMCRKSMWSLARSCRCMNTNDLVTIHVKTMAAAIREATG